ncbi:MAG: SpoIIE family protein phosphatase [Patescibacteria group bacterium]|nr:SpoIIE family protein phosphatase [Patescibacteria group bacterium]
MYIKIRTKLIAVLTTFTVALLGVAAYLLITEKTGELTHDIFLNTVQFADFSSEGIISDYDLYLEEGGFVYFSREVREILAQNEYIYAIKLINYKGEIVYDSQVDVKQKYGGVPRLVKDNNQIYQIQSVNPSVATFDGEIVYLTTSAEDGNLIYVDDEENEMDPIEPGTKIKYFVQPADARFSIVYEMTYENLVERIDAMKMRILYLALLGVLLGILMSIVFTSKLSRSVKILAQGAQVIATGDFKHKVYLHTNDEFEILGNAFNKMGDDLEISTKAIIREEQMKKELDLAASIQMELIPKRIPRLAGMDVAAGMIPAAEVGGDSYDVVMPDENSLVSYIGDATGHGVPAALIASITNALFYHFAHEGDIKNALIEANKVLKEKTTTNMFITLCITHYDATTGKFSYASAGHEKVLLYKAVQNKVIEMPGGGMALGMAADISGVITVQEIPMEPGDTALLYTDGIPEAWKSEKEQYGIVNLKRALQEYSDLPTAEAIKNAMLADVKEYTGGYEQKDDMTILVFKKS